MLESCLTLKKLLLKISASSMDWEGNAAMNCLKEIQRRELNYFQESFETLSLNNNQGHFQMVSQYNISTHVC